MNQQKVVRRVTVCLLFVFALGSTQRSLANPNFCSICNHPIRDVAYLVRDRMEGEQKHICEECSLLNRRCFLCGLPIRENYQQLPDGAVVEQRPGLRVKGKRDALDAYVLVALP